MKRIVVALSFLVAAAMPLTSSADVTATLNGDVRITADLDDPGGGLAGDENGGFTSLIVGINTGNVENWALMGFNTTGAGSGEVATFAQLTIGVQTGFGGGANHGTADDTFSIHSLYGGNAGWDPGTGTIQNNAANVAPNGVVTFQQQAFGQTDWVDGSGANVADFRGAYDPGAAINANTVNGWISGSAPATITFDITDVALAQSWLDNGFADIVLQVNDDGSNTSRFNLTNESSQLTIFTVPEPSAACLMIAGIAGSCMRRRRA